MNTFGWVLILVAILIGRSVYKGRALNIGEDLSDGFLALVSNDTAKLKEVLGRTGGSNTAALANLSLFGPAFNAVGGTASAIADGLEGGLSELERRGNNSVALAAVILGGKAKGYRWAASGPDYYDCSGLMWAAMKLTKAYTGSRYNTTSFASAVKGTYVKVSGPAQLEDIVLWPLQVPFTTGHMGVCTGPDKFYSARSVKSGIGETKISTFRSDKPTVYRRVKFPSPDSPGGSK